MVNQNANAPYLEVRGLVKWFGADRAVDNISFGVEPGNRHERRGLPAP
jgi:ABC-type phosphonate transport system ATPase subunit